MRRAPDDRTIVSVGAPPDPRWVKIFDADIEKDEAFERRIFVREVLIVLVLLLLVLLARSARAQQPSLDARVHPELTDSTWGRRTLAVWQIAWAAHWAEASRGFAALQLAQPDAVEPLLGRAFVARGTGHFEEARAWYQAALAHDSSLTAAKTELAALQWEDPSSLEFTGGATAIPSTGGTRGTAVVEGDLNLTDAATPVVTILARLGALEPRGDPLEGVILGAAPNTSSRVSVLGGGAVIHPLPTLWLTPRLEEWFTPAGRETFAWLDGALRVAPSVTAVIGLRPLSGSTGPIQVSGGADVAVGGRQTLTFVAARGFGTSPFEARGQIRAFWQRAPASPLGFRLGLIRDIDARLGATTVVAGGSAMVTPTRGFRLELDARSGAYARRTITGGVIARW